MKKHLKLTPVFALAVWFLFGNQIIAVQETKKTWPQRVLITNDNGIDDVKIIELARSFARVADTYVAAPSEDRSASTHYTTVFTKGSIEVQKRFLGKGIEAYSVKGYPADCVIFALLGLLRDNPPDLVVSGINGGPNLGMDWIGSGTIGAARMAAFAGLPAIAVSGLDDDCPECVAAVNAWVVELAQSKVVRNLESGQYLTVSIPRKLPSKIKGVKIAVRAPILAMPIFTRGQISDEVSNWQKWVLKLPKSQSSAPEDSDISVYNSDYIAVVPMRADEHDYKLLSSLSKNLRDLPSWTSSRNSN